MRKFDPQAFGPAVAELLPVDLLCPLGPGSPQRAFGPRLQELDENGLLGGRVAADREMTRCCLAGLWLVHDFLDESHRISQTLPTTSGSYWHGIMHRREPDFANAKYWFQRVGDHPIFPGLCAAANELAGQSTGQPAARFLVEQPRWDPMRFVDLCESVARGRSSSGELCRQIAQVEWWLLFEHCYQRALGP